MRKLDPIEAQCLVCSKRWMVSGGEAYYVRIGRKKYCGRECMAKAYSDRKKGKLPDWLTTEEMKKKIALSHKGKRSGKEGKRYPQHQGANHWNWKGGITDSDKAERVRFRRQLQQMILERDNYTCQICDEYSGYLQVDHIKSWKNYPELRFEKDNCRTLCMACHYYVTFKRKLPRGVIWGHNLSRRVAL